MRSNLRRLLSDNDTAVTTFTFGKGVDSRVFAGDMVHNTAVSGIQICHVGITGFQNFFYPFTGLFCDLVGTLLFVIGDVDIDPRYRRFLGA